MNVDVVLHGDALTVLRTLPDGCVQCVVTSPPYYGLRSYGTQPVVWGGVSTCEHMWGDPIRTPWANAVPGPNGRKKNLAVSHWQSKETGPFCQHCNAWRGELGQEPTPALFIQHLVQVFREVHRVLRDDGVLWLNLGDSYAADRSYQVRDSKHVDVGNSRGMKAKEMGFKPKDLMLIPHRVAIALQDDGWWCRMDICWAKDNAMPESVTDRPTRSHEYVFQMTKSADYYYDADAIREGYVEQWIGRKRPRSSKINLDRKDGGIMAVTGNPNGRNARSVWHINTEAFPGAHYAVFPTKLAERCILASSRSGDLVLDPFGGRGTVGLVAKAYHRHYILIDAKAENVAMAQHFIATGGVWKREKEHDGVSLWENAS